MAHEVLVEVDEGQQITHLGRVEEPLILTQDHMLSRVGLVLLEDPVACILLRVGDIGGIDDDGVDEGDGRQALVFDRAVPWGIIQDKPRIDPSSRLAVDMASEAIDDLLGTTVDGEDQFVEELVGLYEAYIL